MKQEYEAQVQADRVAAEAKLTQDKEAAALKRHDREMELVALQKETLNIQTALTQSQHDLAKTQATLPARQPPTTTNLTTPPQEPQRRTKTSLPKLTIAPFRGDILDWPRFDDQFTSQIHSEPDSLSPLKSSTTFVVYLEVKRWKSSKAFP